MMQDEQKIPAAVASVNPKTTDMNTAKRTRRKKEAAEVAGVSPVLPASSVISRASADLGLEKKPIKMSVPVVPLMAEAPPAVSIASAAVPPKPTSKRLKALLSVGIANEKKSTSRATVTAPKTGPAGQLDAVDSTKSAAASSSVSPALAPIAAEQTKPLIGSASTASIPKPAAGQTPTAMNYAGLVSAASLGKRNKVFAKRVGFGKPTTVSQNTSASVSSSKLTRQVSGFLDTFRENLPVVRLRYGESEEDAFVPPNMMRKYKLQPGDVIEGTAREPKETDRYWGLVSIEKVNGMSLEEYLSKPRVKFHQLTPVYPDEQIKLETGAEPISTRMVDLIAPIGKGQRSLVVSPPKAGKTSLLKEIATGVATNYPDIFLMAVLIGERPEEVTDLRRHIEKITQGKGEVAASNFDEAAENQCRVAELALERAKRLVEKGMDVVILLDSITRLARAYNLSIPTSGRTLSGGFDPAALFPPKRFFGAARNFEVPGSLTIIGTALVDTGSRMDDLVYEEFKGTGNQELHLDRRLAERRIFPAIEVQKSGTRRDDLLMDPVTYQSVLTLQRMLDTLDNGERTVTLMQQMRRTKSNREFLQSLRNG